jgi:hypothetical protein
MNEPTLNEILRFKDFCRLYPSLIVSEAAGRALIFHSATNGLDEAGAILRKGRAIYVVLPRFKEWLLLGASNRTVNPDSAPKALPGNGSSDHNAPVTQAGVGQRRE